MAPSARSRKSGTVNSRRAISPSRIGQPLSYLLNTLINAILTLETSFDPRVTLGRLKLHKWVLSDTIYIFHASIWVFWVTLIQSPAFPLKLMIPILYLTAILLPITSQFFLPALPILTWVLTFYSSRFIPTAYRPAISVSVLPTLESVLYGANISDILTRYTHPVLDVLAWLPYGVIHFVGPFVLAAFIWLFSPRPALKFWADVFGYMNLAGVVIQDIFPCAAPWYELIYGLTPANYSMKGSPGGLARIDAIFGGNGYNNAFSNAPVPFGAFPSLHSGCATLEALVISHFFPRLSKFAWTYAGILYWATMYLTHHYLVDVVGGACLAIAFFYLFLPAGLRDPAAASGMRASISKHEQYDLEAGPYRPSSPGASPRSSTDSNAQFATYRSPNQPVTPTSGAPLIASNPAGKREGSKRSHKHTASIANLIRADERVEDGWSPVGQTTFVFPATDRRGSEQVASALADDTGLARARLSPSPSVAPSL